MNNTLSPAEVAALTNEEITTAIRLHSSKMYSMEYYVVASIKKATVDRDCLTVYRDEVGQLNGYTA